MLDDIFVLNHVTHTFNLSPENVLPNRPAQILASVLAGTGGGGAVSGTTFAMHGDGVIPSPPPGARRSDWAVDLVADTNFLETDIDVAVHHTLPVFSMFKDGLSPFSKTVEALTKYPDRFLGYVSVDPVIQGVDGAIEELDRQLDMSPPGIIGLKLYPAQAAPARSWRMDDPKVAFPLFERAQERGLKNIAIHKAVPFPGIPLNPYRSDDVDGAAVEFPDLNFLIVHAGISFVEETAYILAFYPNVYADLETTSWLAARNPAVFELIMAEFIRWGGPRKVIYGDGGPLLCHPQPVLEAFANFQFSDDVCERYGIDKLTREDKALMLGGNFASLCGLDIAELQRGIADDSFQQIRRETGIQEPYSNWARRLNGSAGGEQPG